MGNSHLCPPPYSVRSKIYIPKVEQDHVLVETVTEKDEDDDQDENTTEEE